jgi:hypothetical protein
MKEILQPNWNHQEIKKRETEEQEADELSRK